MSVLSSKTVLEMIRSGEIYFSPLFTPEQVGSVSIDLRMGNLALIVRGSGLSHVDPSSYRGSGEHFKEQTRRQKYERHEFTFHQPLLLHPGMLALVPTLEWVKLPRVVKGVVTARSSWAREGLSIATANFIGPGYNGIITLELSNLGAIPLALYPGMRIAQIAFYKVEKPSRAPKASYFNFSFEPIEGNIVRDDEPFIPVPKPRS